MRIRRIHLCCDSERLHVRSDTVCPRISQQFCSCCYLFVGLKMGSAGVTSFLTRGVPAEHLRNPVVILGANERDIAARRYVVSCALQHTVAGVRFDGVLIDGAPFQCDALQP